MSTSSSESFWFASIILLCMVKKPRIYNGSICSSSEIVCFFICLVYLDKGKNMGCPVHVSLVKNHTKLDITKIISHGHVMTKLIRLQH